MKKTVTFNNINIDIHPGPIGISVSGGADSALLLYILLKNAISTVHVITYAIKERNRLSPYSAVDVISKCIDLTGNTDVIQHIIYVNKRERDRIRPKLIKMVDSKLVDIIYTGSTKIPPWEILENFPEIKLDPELYQRRSPDIVRNEKEKYFYNPFANLNKQDISKLYDVLGITDELFPVTRSCEDISLTSGHCGTCWWCKERFWAFNRL
jgi:tRNA(Ile)-lysidine synthase TilS/MesJ